MRVGHQNIASGTALGGVALPAAEGGTVALCFFGKIGGESGPSRNFNVSGTASEAIVKRSQSSWSQHVLSDARFRFDVFSHFWSPEIAQTWDTVWQEERRRYPQRVRLVASRFESTRYRGNSTTQLKFRCFMKLCARTMSGLSSIVSVLRLKREQEEASSTRYDLVVVTRHDLVFAHAWRMPSLRQRDEWTLHIPGHCYGRCLPSGRLPGGCKMSGRACPWPYIPGSKQAYRTNDWLFWGSTKVADAMSEVLAYYPQYEPEIRKTATCSAMHYFLSYHAHQRGMSIAFGPLMVDRDVRITRMTQPAVNETDLPPNFICFRKTAGIVPRPIVNLSALPHPDALNQQCPWTSVGVCSRMSLCNAGDVQY